MEQKLYRLPAVFLAGRPWIQIFALLIVLHNLYCVMIQRYNLIRIDVLLEKRHRKKEFPVIADSK